MAVGLAEPESLHPVRGIRLSCASAGLYPRPRPDLILIACPDDAVCSAVFTRNAFCAAPVTVARRHLQKSSPSYCLVNAGNANAGTGERGEQDAITVCAELARIGGCHREQVLPFSTGVIGEFLPVEKIRNAMPELLRGLEEDNWLACARAIMTTDTVAKGATRRITIDGRPVTITGIAKGSGMIRPDMATMLAFIATDAALGPSIADAMLKQALAASFNRICVDGDTSTNDACLFIASGAGALRIPDHAGIPAELQQALNGVCADLARAIVRDGEGASKFITVTVTGGAHSAECLQAAYAIATSPLVKTACFASDPNWGRILAAVGRSGLSGLDVTRVTVYLNGVTVAERGARSPAYTEEAGRRAMAGAEIEIRVDLGRGACRESVWTCDLSHEYVRINAEYRS